MPQKGILMAEKKMKKKKTVKGGSSSKAGKKKSHKKNISEGKGPTAVVKRSINFRQVDDEKEIRAVFDYNIDAFSDTPDFHWGIGEIKEELKHGWELHAVLLGEEVIAAVFLKLENAILLSKNTAIKMLYQGSGFSHQIKAFVESKAKEMKARKIIHYCRIDNFRMYSLNEGHGYKKTNKKQPDEQVVEWVKLIK